MRIRTQICLFCCPCCSSSAFHPSISTHQVIPISHPKIRCVLLQFWLSPFPPAPGPDPCIMDTATAPRPAPWLFTEPRLPTTEKLTFKLCFIPLSYSKLQRCPVFVSPSFLLDFQDPAHPGFPLLESTDFPLLQRSLCFSHTRLPAHSPGNHLHFCLIVVSAVLPSPIHLNHNLSMSLSQIFVQCLLCTRQLRKQIIRTSLLSFQETPFKF